MIPYDPPMISRLLRTMPPDRLATVTDVKFRTGAQVVTPGKIIRELISNEKQRRAALCPK